MAKHVAILQSVEKLLMGNIFSETKVPTDELGPHHPAIFAPHCDDGWRIFGESFFRGSFQPPMNSGRPETRILSEQPPSPTRHHPPSTFRTFDFGRRGLQPTRTTHYVLYFRLVAGARAGWNRPDLRLRTIYASVTRRIHVDVWANCVWNDAWPAQDPNLGMWSGFWDRFCFVIMEGVGVRIGYVVHFGAIGPRQ